MHNNKSIKVYQQKINLHRKEGMIFIKKIIN